VVRLEKMHPHSMKSQKAFWLETAKFICIIPLCFLHTPVFAFPFPSALTQVNPKAAADELLQKGHQQYQAKQLEAAIISWKQSREMYKQLQEPGGESKALLNLGTAYLSLERYQDAIATLESSLPLTQSLHNRRDEAQALGNLGIAYNAIGNYSKAISSHKQAGKILLAIGDRQGLGQVLLNLGKTFAVLGDDDNAITAFEQSLLITQQIGDPEGEGIAQGSLGNVYANLGKYKEAIAAHKQSLKIAQDIKNPSAQASALINLGSTYHSQRQGEKARSYYQQALEIAKSAGDRRRQAEALGSLGLIYEDAREHTKAIECQEESLAIAEKIGDPAFQGMVLNNLGHALFGAGKLKVAEDKLRTAVKLLDNLRPGLSDTYKVSIFDTQVHTYNLLQQILVAANQPEASLEASEQGRARAFAELLSRRIYQEGGQTIPPSISNLPPPNIQKIREIARQQNATLVEYAIVPDDDFKFRGKQRGKEQELLIWVVQPTGKVALRRVDLKPLWRRNGTLSDVIQISCCYILNESYSIDQCLRKSPGEGEKLMEALSQLKPTQTGQSSSASQDFRQILHQFLIQAIADLLPNNPDDHVIFIPQETLFLVPFPALQDKKGKYLIEQHTILTAPSIQLLELTRNLKDKRKQLAGGIIPSIFSSPSSTLIVGNPIMPQPLPQLKQAEQEAKDIAQLFNTTAIIGVQATKANILVKLSSSKLVHLATHGILDYGIQNTSLGVPGALAGGFGGAIALTPSGKDAGWLTANEIFNLRMNADLVVLSACKTGIGRISGDGVIGLSRALITAGSLSVVVSLWSVKDNETANLMTLFYQSLQKNPDKAAALRHAMLETMKKQPQPLYWAAFTLMGES
jgi:CHAT domain-containing protein/Tfp pilus assembly protein PilF